MKLHGRSSFRSRLRIDESGPDPSRRSKNAPSKKPKERDWDERNRQNRRPIKRDCAQWGVLFPTPIRVLPVILRSTVGVQSEGRLRKIHSSLILAARRFPPPWSIEEGTESFTVRDANGQALAYLYFEDEPQRQISMKRLSRDEAFLLAVNIAKLPSVPRQILKDIPRPPNSASRND
jgi:hypothetical protein